MRKVAIIATLISALLTAAFTAGFILLNHNDICEPMAITFGTITFHLAMRLLVGLIFDKTMNNKVNYNAWWFRVGDLEISLYKLIRVRKWKKHLPSFESNLFNPNIHSWDEIAQAMCQAELVHETIVILSFLPIISSIWLGQPIVFVLTSIGAALFDLIFVIMQRYNRPRILRVIDRVNRK